MATYSFTIGGAGYNVRAWPRPIIRPAIKWVEDTSKNKNGSDRGAAQDVYEAECVFFDTETNINALETTFEGAREGLTLASFTAPLFAPNVSHSGSISATVTKMGQRKHLAFGRPVYGVYELPVTFRALSPSLVGTSPSLSTLKVQPGFEAGKSFEVSHAFTYDQGVSYYDSTADAGRFKGVFLQTTAQAQAILAYLLTTARANTISFPSIGVTYPFGVTNGAFALDCRVLDFSIQRVNFVFWEIQIEFCKVN